MSDVLYEAEHGVATVTLNRPERLNAWTPGLAAGLRGAMERATADDAVRAVVLTGAGRAFCAGADMGSLTDISAAGEVERAPFTPFDPAGRADFAHPMTWLPAVSKPVIAAVNGPAAGLGLATALFCDLRFAAPEAVFVTAFSRRGLVAEHGTSWMLTRLVGHSRALDLMLSSRRVGADEALRIGLADRVGPLADAQGYARDLAQNASPRSTRVIKRQLWDALFDGLAASMADADREMALSLRSDDFREGVAHFVEKRAPRFTGR